jgi:hypothetical protein
MSINALVYITAGAAILILLAITYAVGVLVDKGVIE